MNKGTFFLVAAVLIFAAFFASSYFQSQQAKDIVGGDRDEHGCIGSAGYSWCEATQKCIRTWEEECTSVSKEEQVAGGAGMANPAAVYCREMGYDYRIVEDESGQRGECLTKEGVWVDEWALYRGEIDVAQPYSPPIDPLAERCRDAGGKWDECGNKCQLDNQGKEGVACTLQCESLCECGGLAGYRCPEGYSCKMPSGVADALGYCIQN